MGTIVHRMRAPRWRQHPHAGAFCLFAVVICGVYWSVLDGTRSLITNGPFTQPLFVIDPAGGGPVSAPLTRLAASSWLHLQLPVVDPFQGFGIPLLSNQGVPVYPPELVAHLLFPGNYSIWLVVNLVALAFGVYLLARAFGQGFFGAMAAGLLAVFAGAAPPNVNELVQNPLAVLPFVLLAVRYAVDPDSAYRRVAMLGIGTCVALLCLSGFQEVLPLMAVLIVVYTIALLVHYGTWRARPLAIAGAAVSAVTGLAVGSIGILPTLSVVSAGTTVNGPTTYLSHSPTFWLSTLTLPTITGRAMAAVPVDLGNSVDVLGTPLLVLAVVLALLIALRQGGAQSRWYVFPSLAFVAFGVLAYANLGHVLQLLDVPLLDRIVSIRFLGIVWWIPLCLLVGAVLSEVRVLECKDVLVAFVAAASFDAYFFERFRQALAARHVASGASVAHAPLVAGGVVLVFVAAILALRWLGPGVVGFLLAAVVLASCLYDVPRNFAPGSHAGAVAAVEVPGDTPSAGDQLVYFGTRQLPTDQYSVQLWGPLMPRAYRATLTALFSAAETSGVGPLYLAAPTLGFLALTPRAVSVLRSMGVDVLALAAPLSGGRHLAIPRCGSVPAHAALCFDGEVTSPTPGLGSSPRETYVYRVAGADPLVQSTATPVPVVSTAVAIRRFSSTLSKGARGIPSPAYVTTSAEHLRAPRALRGVSRHATTERVWITLHSASAGVAVLRESFEPGMHATVDGHRATAFPVDGGLWTAVEVGPGTSHIVLDYATIPDLVELAMGAMGLVLLALAWAALGVRRVTSRALRGGTGLRT